jgi:hypothetical protein
MKMVQLMTLIQESVYIFGFSTVRRLEDMNRQPLPPTDEFN